MPPCAIEFGSRFSAEARALPDDRRRELEITLRKLAVSFGQPHLHSAAEPQPNPKLKHFLTADKADFADKGSNTSDHLRHLRNLRLTSEAGDVEILTAKQESRTV